MKRRVSNPGSVFCVDRLAYLRWAEPLDPSVCGAAKALWGNAYVGVGGCNLFLLPKLPGLCGAYCPTTWEQHERHQHTGGGGGGCQL